MRRNTISHLFLTIVLTVVCCCAASYKPKPIVIKDLSRTSNATRVGPLSILAESYESKSVNLKKAGLHGVSVTFQVTGTPPHVYRFNYGDIIGVGNELYMPYTTEDAIILIEDAEKLEEGVKGGIVGTVGGGATGAAAGAALGAILGAPATGAMTGAVTGGLAGGLKGAPHYMKKLRATAIKEVNNRSLGSSFVVTSRKSGVLWFPSDVRAVEIDLEGTPVRVTIDDTGTRTTPSQPMGTVYQSPRGRTMPTQPTQEKVYHLMDSKTFHRQSCVVLQDETNPGWFDSRTKAVTAGGIPCSECNP